MGVAPEVIAALGRGALVGQELSVGITARIVDNRVGVPCLDPDKKSKNKLLISHPNGENSRDGNIRILESSQTLENAVFSLVDRMAPSGCRFHDRIPISDRP